MQLTRVYTTLSWWKIAFLLLPSRCGAQYSGIPMTRISILFSALIFLAVASPSHALTFNFSFAGVQGTISGLADNLDNQSAGSVFVSAAPFGRVGEYVHNDPGLFNDFSVSAGEITFAFFLSVVGDNMLNLDFIGGFGGSGIFVTSGGPASGELSFPSPSQTPVPGALPLFATGLSALGFLVYRRQRKKPA